MRSTDDVTTIIARKLDDTWHQYAVHQAGHGLDPGTFPLTIPLGQPGRADIEDDFATVRDQARTWQAWATRTGTPLTQANRRVHGTTQTLPTHVTVPDVTTAASITGGPQAARLARGQARAGQLAAVNRTLGPGELAGLVRTVDPWTDTDVTLACTAAAWLAAHDTTGLTPRQVPLPGFHAKWLQAHRSVVEQLTGRGLGLTLTHPGRIHLTYLDPDHLAAGRRRHDSATVGDTMEPAYLPRVVIISENKDTALAFPPVPGGIAVEGDGYGPSAHAAVPWLAQAPLVVYWGDIDADGYRILHQFRCAGINAQSILMDTDALETYRPYGTNVDARGRAIPTAPVPLSTLTAAEQAAYDRVSDPASTGPRRIEQERIPLDVAARAVTALAAAQGSASPAGR